MNLNKAFQRAQMRLLIFDNLFAQVRQKIKDLDTGGRIQWTGEDERQQFFSLLEEIAKLNQ